jgi:hypothetical protein
MVIALYVVAFAMIAAGAASIYDGYDIIVMEKGSAKVISGTIAVSAGFVLIGITAALAQLKRVGAAFAKLGEQTASAGGTPPASPAASSGAALDGAPGAPPSEPGGASAPDKAKPLPDEAQAASAPERGGEGAASAPAEAKERPIGGEAAVAPPTVVGTYSSGGNTYVMYSDGSIQAETPTGLFRFDSLDELKAFIAAGGESVPPAR